MWEFAWVTRVDHRFTGGEEFKKLRGQSLGRIIYVGIEVTKIKT